MRARGCTALLSLILMSSAQAASIDCAKASSFVEKAICSDKRLSSMDDQLARLYKAARVRQQPMPPRSKRSRSPGSPRAIDAPIPRASRRHTPIGSLR